MRDHRLRQIAACVVLVAASVGLAASIAYLPAVRLVMLGGAKYDFEIQSGPAELESLNEAGPLLEKLLYQKALPATVKTDGTALLVSGLLPIQRSTLLQLAPKGYSVDTESDKYRLTVSPGLRASQMRFDCDRASSILSARLAINGVAQPTISIRTPGSDTKFSIAIPAMRPGQREKVAQSLLQSGTIGLHLLADVPLQQAYFTNPEEAKTHFGGALPEGTELLESIEKPSSAAPHKSLDLEHSRKKWVLVMSKVNLTPGDFRFASPLLNPRTQKNGVCVYFSDSGREANANLTGVASSRHRLMAMTIGEQIVGVLSANKEVNTPNMVINGYFTHQEAVALANTLEAGMELPPIKLIQSQSVGFGMAPLILAIIILGACAVFLAAWILRPTTHGDTL